MELNDKAELTDSVAKAAKPRQPSPVLNSDGTPKTNPDGTPKLNDGGYRLFDSDGLYLQVTGAGQKYWRMRYWFGGKEKLLALGVFPKIKIALARKRRDDAKIAIAEGNDPTALKKKAKLADAADFASVAEAYLKTRAKTLAPRTLKKARWQLAFINRDLGSRAIGRIEAPELLAVLRKIILTDSDGEASGRIETAHTTKELCGRVFRYGIGAGYCTRDIAADLKGQLIERPTGTDTHHAAIIDPPKVGELLRAIEGYEGQPATRAALQLIPHVFLRGAEIRGGLWSEVDFDKALWLIPAERMKGKKGKKREHLVPLSRQSLAILRSLHKITGDGDFMFPAIGREMRPISENTLGGALHGLGYPSDVHVPHGFRTTASTLMHEAGELSSDIELQMAHVDSNKIRGTYNKAKRIKERAKMMQRWSDRLDTLKAGKPIAKRRKEAA